MKPNPLSSLNILILPAGIGSSGCSIFQFRADGRCPQQRGTEFAKPSRAAFARLLLPSPCGCVWLGFWPYLIKEGKMPDLKHITIAVISITARNGGNGVITLRFTNPCDDADFYLHMPIQNLNK